MTLPLLPPPPQLSPPKYRPDIDGLRALAVLSVVAFHAFPNLVNAGFITGGFIGVDVFFVISGFLISTIIFENLDKGTFSFTEFYSRRITRIFPALLLVLIASYAFGWFALFADEYKQLGMHIAAGAGFFSNFALWNEAGYFDNSSETKPLLHLWSLGIEEQFYIVWPLLLWAAWKKKFNLLTITILVLAISFYLNVKGIKKDAVATFYSPQTRFWELLCGSVLAWVTLYKKDTCSTFRTKLDGYLASIVYREKPVDGNALSNVISFIGMSLLVYGFWKITKEARFPGTKALFPVLGTVLIIAAGPTAWINRTILSNKIAVWFGLISFPLYLWHWPLLSFATIIEGEVPSRNIRIAAVLISVVLAWLTYKLVERPIRFGNQNRNKTATLVLLIIVAGGVGYITFEKDGLGLRNENISRQILQLEQLDWVLKSADPECTAKYPSSQFCNITNINRPPDAIVFGDSHANHFYWGLSEYFKRNGGNLLNMGGGGCIPFFEIGGSAHPTLDFDCYTKMHDMYNFILHNKEIKTVFLSFHHSAYFQNFVRFSDHLNQINNKDNFENIKDALVRTIQMLNASGKKVVIIYDLPDLSLDIKACINARPLSFKSANCQASSIFINDFNQYDLMLSEAVKKTSFSVFYTHQFLDGNFPLDKNGLPAYRDNTHLSIHGSLFFVDKYGGF